MPHFIKFIILKIVNFIITVIFCFAFLPEGFSQSSWKKESEELIFSNAPFKECHASSLVEIAPGKIMATCFGGSREGVKDVTIWITTKFNNKWNEPLSIADGVISDTLRFPCWNPVLFKTKEGKLFLFYKVGPNPRKWWGMMRISNNNGKSWAKPEKLPEGFLGPVKNKPVQLADGTILCPSSKEDNQTWKVYMEKTTDPGKTWEIIPVDTSNTFKVIQPAILSYPNGRLQIVCRSNQDKLVQSWSFDNGRSWSPLTTMNLPNPNSGIDAVTLKNGMQLLVYNPTVSGVDWFNNRGKLNVAVSKDGIHWQDIIVLENGTKEEFSYPAVIQTKDGKVHITYTYDRKNIKHVVLVEKSR